MRIGLSINYAGGFKDVAAEVADLENAGLDIVFVPEAYSFDAVSALGYLAASTQRVELASGILQLYTRTPTLTAMTAAGRAAIRRFTATAPRPSVIRDELLVKVQAADAGDMRAVRDAIRERRDWATAKLARYQRLRARLLDGRSEEDYLARAERIGPYLTLIRGISFEEDNIRWAEHALAVIARRLPTTDADSDAGDSRLVGPATNG